MFAIFVKAVLYVHEMFWNKKLIFKQDELFNPSYTTQGPMQTLETLKPLIDYFPETKLSWLLSDCL
jgi:hypothetical protein